jgi:hypothetical protein
MHLYTYFHPGRGVEAFVGLAERTGDFDKVRDLQQEKQAANMKRDENEQQSRLTGGVGELDRFDWNNAIA